MLTNLAARLSIVPCIIGGGLVLSLGMTLAAAFLTGCVAAPEADKTDYYASFRQDREILMRARWTGRLYVDLVADMGRDGVSMTMPSTGGQTSSAVIFGINDPISGCVDSFVVVNGEEPLIENYYCR